MSALVMVRQTAGALLFVHTSADLGRAIDGVNALFSYRATCPTPEDEVLGVVRCEDVDSTPTSLCHVVEGPPRSVLALRETVGLSGVWSLCSFTITLLGHPDTAEHRRRRLFESLCLHHAVRHGSDTLGERTTRVPVLPVFSREEALDDVAGVVEDLTTRHPHLRVGPTCFLHDPERGLTPWVPRAVSEHRDRGRGRTPSSTSPSLHPGTKAADDTF